MTTIIDLPNDVMFFHIFSYLTENEKLIFLSINKYFYTVFQEIIDKHSLLKDRKERLQKWRYKDTKNDIILDRMMYMYPYHEDSEMIVMIRVRSSQLNNINSVYLHFTNDQWNTYKQYHCCLYKTFGNESLWITILSEENLKWFAIYMKIESKEIWDNNNGWNYSIDNKYHWIPSFYPFYSSYSFIDFHYNKDISSLEIPNLLEWMNGEEIIDSPECIEIINNDFTKLLY